MHFKYISSLCGSARPFLLKHLDLTGTLWKIKIYHILKIRSSARFNRWIKCMIFKFELHTMLLWPEWLNLKLIMNLIWENDSFWGFLYTIAILPFLNEWDQTIKNEPLALYFVFILILFLTSHVLSLFAIQPSSSICKCLCVSSNSQGIKCNC